MMPLCLILEGLGPKLASAVKNFIYLFINNICCTISRLVDGCRSLALVVFIGGVTFAEIAALYFVFLVHRYVMSSWAQFLLALFEC